MNNLALIDEILLKIEKPVRYIGHEVNSVIKDPEKVDIRFAMAFPDVYEIGMSHLGMKIIYEQMNRRDDVWCERVFSPWVDLDKVMREEKIPLFALESQDPVFMFDFLAITIQYEMCYTNILQLLDLAQIGILSSAAARVRITRNRWRRSSICSISERARRSIMISWTFTKNIRHRAAAVRSS